MEQLTVAYTTSNLKQELAAISLDKRHIYCQRGQKTLYLTYGFVAGAYRHIAVLTDDNNLIAGIANLNEFLIFWSKDNLSNDDDQLLARLIHTVWCTDKIRLLESQDAELATKMNLNMI